MSQLNIFTGSKEPTVSSLQVKYFKRKSVLHSKRLLIMYSRSGTYSKFSMLASIFRPGTRSFKSIQWQLVNLQKALNIDRYMVQKPVSIKFIIDRHHTSLR